MSEHISFRICIIVSFLFHAIVFFPWSFINIPHSSEISFSKIELTYFKNDPSDPIIKELNPIMAIEHRDGGPIDGKVSLDPKEEVASEIVSSVDAAEDPGRVNVVKDELKRDVLDDRSKMKDPLLVKKQHEDYCLTVREKIKNTLRKNRDRFHREGEVHVRFKVDKNGILKDLSLAKRRRISNRSLERIALESVEAASPFPPFSHAMQEKELLFKLPIRFVKDD